MNNKDLWWNVLISWMKIKNIYSPFKKNFCEDTNQKWLMRHNLAFSSFKENSSKIQYDYFLWAFEWSSDNHSKVDWNLINTEWSNFRIYFRSVIEHYRRYDRLFIKKLMNNESILNT